MQVFLSVFYFAILGCSTIQSQGLIEEAAGCLVISKFTCMLTCFFQILYSLGDVIGGLPMIGQLCIRGCSRSGLLQSLSQCAMDLTTLGKEHQGISRLTGQSTVE